MSKQSKWCLIALFMLCVPIGLNILLGFQNPWDSIEVIGDSRDWLGFYGSYLGGCLTAIIGFITLLREEKINKLQIQISHKEHYIKELEGRLADCVSLFDYSRVGTISMYFEDKSMYSVIIKDMDIYLNKVMSAANGWYTIYGTSQQKEIRDFYQTYKQCVTQLTSAINEVTKLIISLKKDNAETKDQTINAIKEIVDKSCSYKTEYLNPLLNCANKWIESEREILKKLKSEL